MNFTDSHLNGALASSSILRLIHLFVSFFGQMLRTNEEAATNDEHGEAQEQIEANCTTTTSSTKLSTS